MLLVTNFRTAIVLLCIVTPCLPSSDLHLCWHVDLEMLDNDNAFKTFEGCNDPGQQKCGIQTNTGYGVKCKSSAECPLGDYSNNQVVCGYGYDICCCDAIEGSPNACNKMIDYDGGLEACKKPELRNSDMCRPGNVCMGSSGERVTCEKPPGLTPYCKMEPGTGQGLGCGTLENHNKDCPKNVEYTGNKMVCKDGKCCCKGNGKEPCNILNKQSCQLDEFKELKKCKEMGTTTEANSGPGGKPGIKDPGNGCREDEKGLCAASVCIWGCRRLVLGVLILTLLLL